MAKRTATRDQNGLPLARRERLFLFLRSVSVEKSVESVSA